MKYRPAAPKIIAISVTFLLTCSSLTAQPFLEPELDEPRELIVLLAADATTPTPEEVVTKTRRGALLPGDLALGSPISARYLITDRAEGTKRKHLAKDPTSPEALLQRYVVLTYPSGSDTAGIADTLRRSSHVLHVSPNRRVELSVQPDDPFYSLQWGLPALDLPTAWDSHKGHAYVAVIDIGIDTDHEDLIAFDAAGNWVGGNYRPSLSYDYGQGDSNPDTGEPQMVFGQLVTPTSAGHGTHVSGIVGAHADNGKGVAGVCWNCSLMMSKFSYLTSSGKQAGTQANVIDALSGSIARGAQTISMSLGFRPVPSSDPSWCSGLEAAPDCSEDYFDSLCQAIQLAHGRDILMAAASGNDGSPFPDFPANDDRVLGAAGIEENGQFWNDCSSPSCECGGSNYDSDQFNLPAKAIQSTFYKGISYVPPSCDDSGLWPDGDGYGPCTGTSMAAPHLAGVASLLRSANPLLSKDSIEDLLASNLDNPPGWNLAFGRGKPDARAALEDAFGRVSGQVLPNRLTPLFHLYSNIGEASLSTAAPQMASAAIETNGVYYVNAGPSVPGYIRFPGTCIIGPGCPSPGAYAYVFTSDAAPFPGAPPLVPLYRMASEETHGTNADNRSFFYTTQTAGLEYGKQHPRNYEHLGIEGYIFPNTTDPASIPGTVRLYRLYNASRDDFAIFTESELAYFQGEGYGSVSGLSDWIGYVYPNVDTDSDWVIDGFENLIGTDPQIADSDGDGFTDGQEVLEYPYSDPCNGSCSAEQVVGEAGSAALGDGPRTIILSRSYIDPVVIAQPLSFEDPDTAAVRITDVASDRFTLYIDEPPNLDGAHKKERVSYLVLEAGEWELADGTRLTVGRFDTAATVGRQIANQWAQVSFPAFGTAPVVFTQVQTGNDGSWVKTRQRNVTTTGFQTALEKEEAAPSAHGTETIGWVAIEPGQGSWSARQYLATNTPDAVRASFYTISLFSASSSRGLPVFLASLASYDGVDAAALRFDALTTSSVQVKVEEDTTWDTETGHTTEVVSYMAIDRSGQLTAQPR